MPGQSFTIGLTVGSPTTITSPNYPGSYGNNIEVEYSITAPDGYYIRARFLDFRTEDDFDILTIRSGESEFTPDGAELAQLSGSDLPADVTSPGNTMWMRFTSDQSTTFGGYRIELTAIEREACTDEEFECRSGLCIPSNRVCDTFNDCLDFSDEDYCPQCVDISTGTCNGLLFYNTTIFPNNLAENAAEAEATVNKIMANSTLLGCHEQLLPMLCSVLYPECPHDRSDTGPCNSTCVAVTAACRGVYESALQRDWPLDCQDYTDWHSNLSNLCLRSTNDPLSTDICGTRPGYELEQSRIVGGINARPGEVPWAVALAVRGTQGNDTLQFCTASVIGAKWIITAAHCVVGYVDSLILGDIVLSTPSEYQVVVTPYNIFVNPYWDETIAFAQGDMAIIQLSEPLEFNDYIRPICIPEVDYEMGAYRRCQIAGWGLQHETGVDASYALQRANVGILDREYCANVTVQQFTDFMLCAGYERGGIDSCSGDSGGPLACEADDGRWYLLGIISSGVGCARPANPGFYTRVSRFQSFIDNVLSGNYTANVQEYELLEDSVIVVESPNYPNNYPNHTYILYRVSAPTNYSVQARILNISIEAYYDFLTFGNGQTPISTSEIARFSTSDLTTTVTSSGRYMWIRFISDLAVSQKGFRIELMALPQEDDPFHEHPEDKLPPNNNNNNDDDDDDNSKIINILLDLRETFC
ncbi:enteropeptidase-like [Diadema setosum]|uniref:enteropeptidase-like n=1 Tax=Diadema setosum TaxID=31175 RepID=UPI003B3B1998